MKSKRTRPSSSTTQKLATVSHFLFRYKSLAALIVALLFCVFVVPMNEAIAFVQPTERKLLFISVALKAGFGAFLYLLIYFILEFVQRALSGNTLYRSWLKYSLIYSGIMGVVLLLIYPGHWVWDEFNILNSVKSYIPDSWQNYFTNIFYTFSLFLFPTGVSIVLLQIACISTIVGYVVSRFAAVIKHKYTPVILFAIFLLPPIMLNNFYPLRLPLYSFIELFFFARIVLLYLDGFRTANKYRELLVLSGLIMLLSFWRIEAVYYLIALPILIVVLKIFTKENLRMAAPYMATIGAFVIVTLGGVLTIKTTDTKYSLTTFVNPLTVVLQQHLQGKNLDANLASIDKVLILDKMRQYPSYTEITAFWDGGVRPDYKEHLAEFRKAYSQLVLDNPWLFLKARTKTFLAANGLLNSTPSPVGLLIQDSFRDKTEAFVAERFYATNAFSHPINTTAKRHTTRALLMIDNKDHVTGLGKIVWSIIPVSLGLVFLLVYSLIRRQWFWVIIAAVILTRVVVIFVTAPAHYFMYYLPIYVTGSFVLVLSLLFYLQNRRAY